MGEGMKLVRQSGWYSARDEEAEEVLEFVHDVPGIKLSKTSTTLCLLELLSTW